MVYSGILFIVINFKFLKKNSELEKQRRKEAEEEAKRNIEEQLLQRERLDKVPFLTSVNYCA